MSDLRTRLIRLAYANPEIRESLLPFLKSGRNDLAQTPAAAEAAFNAYKEKHPKTRRTVKDFLDPSAQEGEEGQEGEVIQGPWGDNAEGQKDEKKEKKKTPYKPSMTDTEDTRSPGERLDEAKSSAAAAVNKKYEKHRGEDGEFPDEIKAKMDKEYSAAVNKHIKAEDAKYKREIKNQKDKLTGARKKKDKADREAHSDRVLVKLKEKYGDNEVAIADAHEKAMKKYDKKKKRVESWKNDGFVKTLMNNYKKFQGLAKQWANPESNPVINMFRGAQADAVRVASRHMESVAVSRVVFRHRVAMVDERLLDQAARALMYETDPHKYLMDDGVSSDDAHLAIQAARVSYMSEIKDYLRVAKDAVEMKNWSAVSAAMAAAVKSLGAERLQHPNKALALKMTKINGMAANAGEKWAEAISRNLDEIQTALDAGYPFTRRGRSLLERRSR